MKRDAIQLVKSIYRANKAKDKVVYLETFLDDFELLKFEIRPMFHFTSRRIEAHVCICFVAFKVYKELERILKKKAIGLSVDKVLGIAKTITTIKVKLSAIGNILTKTMLLTSKHKSIAMLFDKNFWKTI